MRLYKYTFSLIRKIYKATITLYCWIYNIDTCDKSIKLAEGNKAIL